MICLVLSAFYWKTLVGLPLLFVCSHFYANLINLSIHLDES